MEPLTDLMSYRDASYPALFMTAATATADTPLRPAWLRVSGSQAGRLAPRGLHILLQVCLGRSGLRMPVSLGVLTVSSRIVMNNAGYNSWASTS